MAVRCSLLGHSFGATEVERQREERGSEVVVTVVEYESCTRCGTRNVISENTEVKRIEPDEPGPEAPEEPVEPDADADPAGADAAEADEPPADPDAAEGEPIPTDEDGEPITDDAEILDDAGPVETDVADGDRERGAWPDADDVGQPAAGESDSTEWPEADPAAESGGELIDAEDDPTGAGGPTGESAEPADPAGADPSTGSGIERAGAAPTPGETSAREDVPVEFFCPRCSFVAPGDRGSLRAGDICPECKKGYLSERER